MANLKIKDLCVNVEGKQIIKNLNLEINSNEVHVIMGPNGSGKSTLSQAIMGHPKYKITSGEVTLNGENILDKEVDQRAKLGLFLSTQYPAEIPGITNSDFLRSATSNLNHNGESLIKFVRRLEKNIKDLKMPNDMINRSLNEGFSGGEKKKNEILQMKMLKPKIAILDEIDSGLDVDALNVVGTNLAQEVAQSDELSLLLITHYQRLLDYIKPTHIHIMVNGSIVKTSDASLAFEIEQKGYDEYLDEKKDENNNTKKSIGQCGVAARFNDEK